MPPSKKTRAAGFSIPATLRSPVLEGSAIKIASEDEHLFFIRCHELYRVIDLVDRTLDPMIEAYSKYRTRDLFRETLSLAAFHSSPLERAKADPELSTIVTSMGHAIDELRISLIHEDALPYTVKTRIEGTLAILKKEWTALLPKIEKRYGWKFKEI